MKILHLYCILGLACGLTWACTPQASTSTDGQSPSAQEEGKTAGAVPPQALAQAKEIYAQRCTLCHGANGQGDGPASASLQPKPRNYADPSWQASVTDVYLQKVILEGGAAVGKSMMMPGNEDLRNQPDVIRGLVQVVRSFRPQS